MYTFNIYVFGHNLSKDKELNNSLNSFDIQFGKKINGKDFELQFPYHGGQCGDVTYSCVFGCQISTDEFNPNHINEIRKFKEEDYIKDYSLFIDALKEELSKWKGSVDMDDEEMDQIIVDLFTFIDNNEPELYSVEASS